MTDTILNIAVTILLGCMTGLVIALGIWFICEIKEQKNQSRQGSNKAEASFRIVRDINGDYRVECLDRPINYWYIVASKMGRDAKGLQNAVDYCNKHFEINK